MRSCLFHLINININFNQSKTGCSCQSLQRRSTESFISCPFWLYCLLSWSLSVKHHHPPHFGSSGHLLGLGIQAADQLSIFHQLDQRKALSSSAVGVRQLVQPLGLSSAGYVDAPRNSLLAHKLRHRVA